MDGTIVTTSSIYKKYKDRRRLNVMSRDHNIMRYATRLMGIADEVTKHPEKAENEKILEDRERSKQMVRVEFMSAHQLYIEIHIHVNESMVAVFSDHAQAMKFVHLLNTTTPATDSTIHVYVEDAEREELFAYLTFFWDRLSNLCHLDDPDYYIDELITKHGRKFEFEGDVAEFLQEVNNKDSTEVTNLEMQYLRQVRNRAIPGQEIFYE